MSGEACADESMPSRFLVSLVGVVLIGLTSACGSGESLADTAKATQSASHGASAAGSPGRDRAGTSSLSDGGASSCVAKYTPQAAANRSFAFDGTVTAIGRGTTDRPGRGRLGYAAVTFTVHEWFRGGSAANVTVDMAPPQTASSVTSVSGGSYDVGSRLLVSGEPRWGGPALRDAVAWGCGFTRSYDSQTASSWRQAARR